MIASSRAVAGLCVLCAVGLHLGALAYGTPEPSVEVEGAAGAQSARLGSAFEDLVQGALAVEHIEDVAQTVTPEIAGTPRVEPVTTAQTTPRVELTPQPKTTQELAPTRSEVTVAVNPVPTVALNVDPTAHDTLTPFEVLPTRRTEVTEATQAHVAATRPAALQAQPTPSETAQAQPDVEPQQSVTEVLSAIQSSDPAPLLSRRPAMRSKSFEEKNAPKLAQATKPQPRKKKPKTARAAAPKGNSQKTTAAAGSASGTANAKAVRQGKVGSATTTGNAAASNYPGKVMRRLSRVSRPRVGSRGTAVVSFQVANNGGLSGVSIARSSGSAQLDRAALLMVRKAAPFPKPPAGAQRSFRINIKGG